MTGTVLDIIVIVLAALIVAELQARTDLICAVLLRKLVRFLRSDLRRDFLMEWEQVLTEQPTVLSKWITAAGFVAATFRISISHLNSTRNLEDLAGTTFHEDIVGRLRSVYDPEVPINVYELGMIEDVTFNHGIATIKLVPLCNGNCPIRTDMPNWLKDAVLEVPEIDTVHVRISETKWTEDRMSDEARLELGFM